MDFFIKHAIWRGVFSFIIFLFLFALWRKAYGWTLFFLPRISIYVTNNLIFIYNFFFYMDRIYFFILGIHFQGGDYIDKVVNLVWSYINVEM